MLQSQRAMAAAASEWGAQRAEKAAARAAQEVAEARQRQEYEAYMQRYEERYQQVRAPVMARLSVCWLRRCKRRHAFQ